MREIGPHKLISYINPDNVDEDKHMWLSADDWGKQVRVMLEHEERSEVFVIKIDKIDFSNIKWHKKNLMIKQDY